MVRGFRFLFKLCCNVDAKIRVFVGIPKFVCQKMYGIPKLFPFYDTVHFVTVLDGGLGILYAGFEFSEPIG